MSFTNFKNSFYQSLQLIAIVFILMLLIEIIVLKYNNFLIKLSHHNQSPDNSQFSILNYITASVFGLIPNCSTTFAIDSLYMSGFLSFGALVSATIAAVDDVGLLLFSKSIQSSFPLLIILIYLLSLFFLGIIGGHIADLMASKLNWKFNIKCNIVRHQIVEFKLKHFIKEHIYQHIIKKHIWRIFIWMFITLFIIGLFPGIFSQSKLMTTDKLYLLIFAALLGLIPSPAPSFLIFNIFALHPASMFSVFLTNSIVQDGHGLLPILGYSFKDALKVKLFKLVLGIVVGLIVLSIGY